ncbi:MlaD family protein [Namhaeicola litoreus]|uniref:MlaD family protein n=1 Tax=Namhaeicola litoreus TaxID=1052145 RepID=A0ABW3Y3H7_9FLAO
MKISREIKTGIIAVLIIVLFIWGYNYLKDSSLMSKDRTFYAVYDNVQGLSPNGQVTINGLKVGRVSNITFHPIKKGSLVVHILMTDDINFSKNTIAEIYSPDFISGKSLRLKLVEDEFLAENGDTLRGEVSEDIIGMINEQIAPLQSKVESFIVNADTVMANVNKVLDNKNREVLSKSLDNLNYTLIKFKGLSGEAESLLSDNSARIDSILYNANSAMKDFSVLSDSLQNANISETLRSFDQTVSNFNVLMDSINKGKGSIGKLVHDESLYDNLEAATKELEELLRDMKEHPKRYVHFSVFGKKEKSYEETKEQN